jgi:hypothetical protein
MSAHFQSMTQTIHLLRFLLPRRFLRHGRGTHDSVLLRNRHIPALSDDDEALQKISVSRRKKCAARLRKQAETGPMHFLFDLSVSQNHTHRRTDRRHCHRQRPWMAQIKPDDRGSSEDNAQRHHLLLDFPSLSSLHLFAFVLLFVAFWLCMGDSHLEATQA